LVTAIQTERSLVLFCVCARCQGHEPQHLGTIRIFRPNFPAIEQ
jgi:hypothetical protein